MRSSILILVRERVGIVPGVVNRLSRLRIETGRRNVSVIGRTAVGRVPVAVRRAVTAVRRVSAMIGRIVSLRGYRLFHEQRDQTCHNEQTRHNIRKRRFRKYTP